MSAIIKLGRSLGFYMLDISQSSHQKLIWISKALSISMRPFVGMNSFWQQVVNLIIFWFSSSHRHPTGLTHGGTTSWKCSYQSDYHFILIVIDKWPVQVLKVVDSWAVHISIIWFLTNLQNMPLVKHFSNKLHLRIVQIVSLMEAHEPT